jgi:hypothetical protein
MLSMIVGVVSIGLFSRLALTASGARSGHLRLTVVILSTLQLIPVLLLGLRRRSPGYSWQLSLGEIFVHITIMAVACGVLRLAYLWAMAQ